MIKELFTVILSLFLFSSIVIAEEQSAEHWMPEAKEFDWVQLASGVWLKGEIKALYNDNLEFETDILDTLNIDWADIKYLKSYRTGSVNIENHEPVTGKLEISGNKVKVIGGETTQEFDRADLISLTPSGGSRLDLWNIKLTLGLNVRSGNSDQVDYNAKFNAERRTARSRFLIDYIGNISKTGNGSGSLEETVHNNRLNTSLNIYATRYFFYQPVFAEFFRDPFQNIDQRITAGVGIGYTIIDSDRFEWHVSGGPAYIATKYESVQPGEEQSIDGSALSFATDFNAEITSALDFIFKYNVLAAGSGTGGYTHHMIATFENEITGSLDFDISVLWDRISEPKKDDQGIAPEPDDYRLMVGVSYTY